MMPKKHTLPCFLEASEVTADFYDRWLRRKAAAHVKRDRKRGHNCTISDYKNLIHQAVIHSAGKDDYTGEQLDWHLISKYTNEASKQGRHAYKAEFAMLPTVDHVRAEATTASFKICAWRTNDAKSDLSMDAFLNL